MFHTAARGNPDGFRCDEHGNIWCSVPHGRTLGLVPPPYAVASLAFGGRARSRLFICAWHALHATYLDVRGAARP